jgi:hypothetical protein
MNVRHVLFLAPVLGVLIAAAVWERSRSSVELADLRRQVASLSTAVREQANRPDPNASGEALRTWIAAAGSASDERVVVHPPQGGERTLETPPSQATPPAISWEERRDRYEAAFAADAVDPHWTVRARHELDRGLAAALPDGSAVRSFECRAEMCRIETSHPDTTHYNEFVSTAFLSLSPRLWNGAFLSAAVEGGDSPDGPRTMVTYVAREGKSLPQVD